MPYFGSNCGVCRRFFNAYRSQNAITEHGEPRYCGRPCAALARTGAVKIYPPHPSGYTGKRKASTT